MQDRTTRILIVDAVKTVSDLLRDIVETDPRMVVLGVARTREEALGMAASLDPDLILMGARLGTQRGAEVAAAQMAIKPRPIVMTAAGEDVSGLALEALEAGVLEIIDKGPLYRWRTQPEGARRLLRQIRQMAKVQCLPNSQNHAHVVDRRKVASVPQQRPDTVKGLPLVAIASSTGGPYALNMILSELPADLMAAVLIVQHMSKGFLAGLAEWLNENCRLAVTVAADGEELVVGRVLLAPDEYHLKLSANNCVEYFDTPPVNGHRPSGDPLFESVAAHAPERSLGVILTGMGRDGSSGLFALHEAGGRTIAQDEASSVVFGMPKAAIECGAVDLVLPLDQIPGEIERFITWYLRKAERRLKE